MYRCVVIKVAVVENNEGRNGLGKGWIRDKRR